eukprot:CAMPEP_0178756180 /NCGR_PEP_ID=MMETSP0744-20121128/13136_1 /TAXON_ID=913974 /ORGANISM="Nitzschia punctata, Strain CCMP561" /LENGTH=237 /DNA_ID=CAMNT_0020410303 /DNA_START=120 /DNA_END=833 /DNA_ORIENTATION=-
MPTEFVEKLHNSPIPVEVVVMKDWGNYKKTSIQRFLPIDEEDVSHVLVRDIDSRPSLRELLAVNEWLASGKSFHIMRDHPYHNTPIMAGMFGVRRGALGQTKIADLIQVFRETSKPDENDQKFLSQYIWPAVKEDTWQHDSIADRKFCKQSSLGCHPFPMSTRSPEFYVGQDFKDMIGADIEGYHCFSTCGTTKPSDLQCQCTAKVCQKADSNPFVFSIGPGDNVGKSKRNTYVPCS